MIVGKKTKEVLYYNYLFATYVEERTGYD